MTVLHCLECGAKTEGTLLKEQCPHTPYDPMFFIAPLCDRDECRSKAAKKGALFA